MRSPARAARIAALAALCVYAGCRNLGRVPEHENAIARAERCLAVRDFDGAKLYFERALQVSPRNARARLGLARTALDRGAPQTALDEAARAERECSLAQQDETEIQAIRGRAYLKLGKPVGLVWAYLHRAYEEGGAEAKQRLYRDLVQLSGQLPPDAPGLKEFMAAGPPGGAAPRQRIRSRRDWDPAGKSQAGIPMGKPFRITVHHSAHDAFIAGSAARSAAASADVIRRMHAYHVQNRHWQDIGYHFIIDPRGEIWEGRPVRFQGAHAGAAHNKGNLGICVIGNYDAQGPSAAQTASLTWLVRRLCAKYDIPSRQIFAHGELKATTCPGRFLKRVVVELRK